MILKCEAYSSFGEVSSDHKRVFAKNQLSLHRNMKQTIKASRYDWSLLINSDIRNQYTVTVRNKFDTIWEISKWYTPNDEYENFYTTHIETVAVCIPTKPRAKYKVRWESTAEGKAHRE